MSKIEFGTFVLSDLSKKYLQEVFDSNWFTMGPKVKQFETKFAEIFKYKYCRMVSSGTTADTISCLALYELGAKAGDEIICPALSFIATANSIRLAGFKPVFVDVCNDLNIDVSLIEKAITSKTRAIMAVNLMGRPAELDVIQDIAKRHGLYVIVDNCFPAGSKVYTNNGYKNIEDININDMVLTHNSRFKKVVNTFKVFSNRKLYTISSNNKLDTFSCTDEHPVFILKSNKFLCDKKDPEWISVKNIKIGDYLVKPIINEENDIDFIDLSKYDIETKSKHKESYKNKFKNKLELNDDLLTFIGWYLAEGLVYRNQIILTLGKKEIDNINNLTKSLNKIGLDFHIKETKTTTNITILDKQLSDFIVNEFNTGSSNKKIPEWVLYLPKNKLKILLDNYILGDGCKIKSCINLVKCSSVSFELLTSIQLICFKLGYFASLCKISNSGKSKILNREVNIKDKFQLNINKSPNLNKNERRYFIGDKYVFIRVKNIEASDYNDYVYNLEVENDNSYCINGLNIVHNCEAYGSSFKGKRSLEYADFETTSHFTAHICMVGGESGCVFTKEERYDELVEAIRNHGRVGGSLFFDHPIFGINGKSSDLYAAIGLGELETFWENFYIRRANIEFFRNSLIGYEDLVWMTELDDADRFNAPHAFSVTFKNPNNTLKFKQDLDKADIHLKRNFGCMATHGTFKYLGHTTSDFPVAEYMGNNGWHWGCHRHLSQEDLDYLVDCVHKSFRGMTV